MKSILENQENLEIRQTVVLVEQNAFAALKVAHYAYVLETGAIVLQGTGEELLSDERVIQAYLGG